MKRLDKALVESGLVESRTLAQKYIAKGFVKADGKVVSKASSLIAGDCSLQLLPTEPLSFSNGALKLSAALRSFKVDPTGFVCLDIGISTGGFTFELLQAGAARVIGIDVGQGQLHPTLAVDTRLELREKVNARYLSTNDFDCRFDMIVVDVSFISLTLILPVLPPLLKVNGSMICLIKPQFEVGRDGLGKGGIVLDPVQRVDARKKVHRTAFECGLILVDSNQSPVQGGDGNIEYLSFFRRVAALNPLQV